MASKKTQQESEQPAKVYQLDAVQSEVAALKAQMTKGFDSVNESLSALLLKSNSQVTPQQLVDNITAVTKSFDEKIDDVVDKIHLEYGPIKENNKWFIRAIAAQGIIIIGQLIFTIIVIGSS